MVLILDTLPLLYACFYQWDFFGCCSIVFCLWLWPFLFHLKPLSPEPSTPGISPAWSFYCCWTIIAVGVFGPKARWLGGSATTVHSRGHPSGWSLSLAGWCVEPAPSVTGCFLAGVLVCEPCLLEWEILWRSAGQGSSQRGVGAEFMVLARLMERWQRCHQRQTN